MSAYLSSLVAISALVGICSFLSYSETTDRGLKIAVSVILVYTVILPAVTLVREAVEFDFDYYQSEIPEVSFEDTEFSKTAEQSFADGIKKMIAENFSLSSDEVKVFVFGFDGKRMKAEKIKIILTGTAIVADARRIAYAVSLAGLGECEVEIGG